MRAIIMSLYKKMSKGFRVVDDFLFRWVFPAAGSFLVLLTLTPIGEMLGIKFKSNTLIVLLIFFIVSIGAKLLKKSGEKIDENILNFVLQENAISTAFNKIPAKGTDVRILIYTSFSIFNNFYETVEKFKELQNSNIRVLLRDPDLPALVPKGQYSSIRRSQINTALDAVFKYREKNDNIEIRFYSNEPWVRGIQIGSEYLLYSGYANKKIVVEGETEIEYSGTRIPWVEIDSKIKDDNIENIRNSKSLISGFESLFDLVWDNCAKNKNIIFDLDGTLYEKSDLTNYFAKTLPRGFMKQKLASLGEEVPMDAEVIYDESIKNGFSGTESLLNSVNNFVDKKISLSNYLAWKDHKLDANKIEIDKNIELAESMEFISKTFNLYILTNHTSKFANIAINKMGISRFFPTDSIITIDKIGHIKPSPQIRNILREEYKINLSASIFIGDRVKVDLSYVNNFSLGCILIDRPEVLPEMLKKLIYPFEWFENHSKTETGYKIIQRDT